MGESLPTAGAFLNADALSQFNGAMDQMIVDNNKPVRVFFDPVGSGCPNCFIDANGRSNGVYTGGMNPFGLGQFNKSFPIGTTCPVCQGSHQIFTEDSSKTYSAMLTHNPEEIKFEPVNENTNIIKSVTVACSFSDMRRANYAMIEGERMVRLTNPVHRGFAPANYVHTVWISQDG